MRKARIADGFRRSQETSRYKKRLLNFSLKEVEGFEKDLSIDFSSALTAICGKNGVGKSSFLKLIYFALTKQPVEGYSRTKGEFSVQVQDSKTVLIYNSQDENVHGAAFYFEPAKECHRVLEYLRVTQNFEELLEGLEPFSLLKDKDAGGSLQLTIGKIYRELDVYEVEGAIDDDVTFPYFKATLLSGVTYSNAEMGMGEYICLYVFWLLKWVPDNSIVLLDELDSFIAVYSQKALIEYIAFCSSNKALSIVMSTHSEVIISSLGLNNALVLSSFCGNLTRLVKPKHEQRYLYTLGVSPKIKGAFLVEDKCARIFLETIVKTFSEDIFGEFDFIELRCDSNLEKLANHFEPHAKLNYEMIIVFDADQSKRIKKINEDYYLYTTALPCSGETPPDVLLWDVLIGGVEEVAVALRIRIERLTEVIESHLYANLHDRLVGVVTDLGLTIESVIHILTSIWVEKNPTIAEAFFIALELRGKFIPYARLSRLLHERLGVVDMAALLPDSRDEDQFAVTFNGLNLEFSKRP